MINGSDHLKLGDHRSNLTIFGTSPLRGVAGEAPTSVPTYSTRPALTYSCSARSAHETTTYRSAAVISMLSRPVVRARGFARLCGSGRVMLHPEKGARSRWCRDLLRSRRSRWRHAAAVDGVAGTPLAVSVPARSIRRSVAAAPSCGSRPASDGSIGAIEDELAARRDGYQQAALAHLTLLLIEIARLAGDVVDDLRRSGEPLLADVFAVIERHHSETLSLRDVARELAMTPGHLTTIVRRRTGRTVQEWITERRMAEARDLFSETELPISEVARLVGMTDPGYFSRVFRRMHGTSPRQWRGRRV